MSTIRSSQAFKMALRTLLLACLFVCTVRLTEPGSTVRIQPVLAAGEAPQNRAIWVLDIAGASAPKTDWERVTLGKGWRKGSDSTLPSGAAALSSDATSDALVYQSPDNALDVALAQGPEFGRVRISIGRATTDINLQAAQAGVLKQRIERPWFYQAQTASLRDWLITVFWVLFVWLLFFAAYAVVTRPQRVQGLIVRMGNRLGLASAAVNTPLDATQPLEPTRKPAFSPVVDEVVISVKGVGKMYRIYSQPIDRLKQMFNRGRQQYGREFWALRNVSFEVRRGETMGIIGRNGSGKSTLLQMIAGTLTPTEGEVRVNGRVAALLELGSGFNPEFTGRENVFLNGAVLGLSHEEMAKRLGDIIAFADIGQFVDQPVKTYSSGMMVRLAFAVQASIEPDILIIDEALTVGDVFFQQKCYRHLEKLRERGTAILLVSHGMGDIKQYCQRALLLQHGQAAFLGMSADAVAQYLLFEHAQLPRSAEATPIDTRLMALESEESDFFWPKPNAFLAIDHLPQISNGMAHCTAVAVCDLRGEPRHMFQQGETVSFFYEFEILETIETPLCGIEIHNDKGITVHGKNSLQYDPEDEVPPVIPRGARLRCRQDVTLAIAVGEYTYEVGMGMIAYDDYKKRGVYATTALYPRIMRICHLNRINRLVVTERVASEQTAQQSRLMHWGLANLPGSCRLRAFLPADDVVQDNLIEIHG